MPPDKSRNTSAERRYTTSSELNKLTLAPARVIRLVMVFLFKVIELDAQSLHPVMRAAQSDSFRETAPEFTATQRSLRV